MISALIRSWFTPAFIEGLIVAAAIIAVILAIETLDQIND